ncbi:MAG: hypothetical protein SWX82_16405 [Cyanobacteriota bacterium]|nr:hypothetical protein [Cyanobacteriota bacterium]
MRLDIISNPVGLHIESDYIISVYTSIMTSIFNLPYSPIPYSPTPLLPHSPTPNYIISIQPDLILGVGRLLRTDS